VPVIVEQFDLQRDLLLRGGHGHHRRAGAYGDAERGHHHQLARLVAVGKIGLAPADRLADLHGHALHRVSRDRHRRGRSGRPVEL
jgi:hypothetical protein